MTTLLWNFKLLQLISKAKIRYNSQNTTTKNSRKLVKFDDKTLPCRAVDSNCEGGSVLSAIPLREHLFFIIIIIYRFEIKEMPTLFWNFELLQLISAAKIRYNSQNNTTKKIRVDSWLNIFVFLFSAFSVPLRENSLGCGSAAL